jgi:deoxyribodipyrimidine photolyase-related protein
MQKPYLSSSNYILKMSNYQKDGHWEEIWNALYYYFLYDKENEIKKTQMARNLVIWSKKSTIEKKKIKESANKIIRELTEDSLTPIDKMD